MTSSKAELRLTAHARVGSRQLRWGVQNAYGGSVGADYIGDKVGAENHANKLEVERCRHALQEDLAPDKLEMIKACLLYVWRTNRKYILGSDMLVFNSDILEAVLEGKKVERYGDENRKEVSDLLEELYELYTFKVVLTYLIDKMKLVA